MDSWKENYFLTGETQDQIHFRSIGKMIRLTKHNDAFTCKLLGFFMAE